jgi:hypothetical protein
MNNTLKIYVEGVLLDLYGDESVNIKTSVKDFKSIDKVFTSFSRNINIPASKTNNRVFKHFNRSEIIEGGFDARSLKDAELKLNDQLLEKGKVALESVQESQGVAVSYGIRFYGALTEFKKRLGQDYIHNVDTSNDDIANPNYKSLLTNSINLEPALTFPLASSKNRFVYDSGDLTSSDVATTTKEVTVEGNAETTVTTRTENGQTVATITNL